MVAGGCIGYDEIRSMSGQYTSYWNAFLFQKNFILLSSSPCLRSLYCAELTSNFRSIEVRRYLDLRVARSTSVLFEVSMSNLPGHSCSCAPHSSLF